MKFASRSRFSVGSSDRFRSSKNEGRSTRDARGKIGFCQRYAVWCGRFDLYPRLDRDRPRGGRATGFEAQKMRVEVRETQGERSDSANGMLCGVVVSISTQGLIVIGPEVLTSERAWTGRPAPLRSAPRRLPPRERTRRSHSPPRSRSRRHGGGVRRSRPGSEPQRRTQGE